MRPSRSLSWGRAPQVSAFLLASAVCQTIGVSAAAASAVSLPNLDFSSLGQVAVAGDFDSISVYKYEGQQAGGLSANGSGSLLTRYPDGTFEDLGLVDAEIFDMCSFEQNGKFQGVVLCGNFTSIGGVPAGPAALYNPNNTNPVTPLNGLSGRCNAVYCDNDAGTVFFGGSFMGGNSTNALAWTNAWQPLPFAGFNGPVNAITKNAAGNIVFAGAFDGLGNSTGPKVPDQQVINLGGGVISASGTTAQAGFSTASDIICKTGAQAGAGNTWLLADNTQGWWEGRFGFGFIPTKLRLYNVNQGGRGSKTFYFEDLNSGGILNMSYVDASGQAQSCITDCPLLDNGNAQDFRFSPTVGMSMFRIYITSWYGAGGGLSGIEMFQDDIYSFANNSYNEPQCDGVSATGSSSTVTPAEGLWTGVPMTGAADAADSGYLSATFADAAQLATGASVVFHPDIKQSGNYSITVWTPGCLQDNSCGARGLVNITGQVAATGAPVSRTIAQTNNYPKYDEVYYGYVDATGSFRPSITLSPVTGQQAPLTIVAQKVRFDLVTSTGGLNGLYEYKPGQTSANTDFASSAVDAAGAALNAAATVNSVINYQSTLYVAGSFAASSGISNVARIGSNVSAVAAGGLNGAVLTAYHNASEPTVYYGGAFTSSADGAVKDLNHLAAYSLQNDKWSALGAGVDGNVSAIVPLRLNISATEDVECIAVTGQFSSINSFGGAAAAAASGFAVWVPSRNNWLNNLANVSVAVTGELTAFTTVPGSASLWAGQIAVRELGTSNVVELVDSGAAFEPLGLQITAGGSSGNSSAMQKRAETGAAGASGNYSGVYTGLYYNQNGLNITVVGGAFSATATNGSLVQDLVFINNTGSQRVITGLPVGLNSSSTFKAMDAYSTQLFAGGSVRGAVNGNSVNGLVVYDLAASKYAATQPAPLGGSSVTVNAIRVQPSAQSVYVAGSFDLAGSLPCGALCVYDPVALAWNSPGVGLAGTVAAMTWASGTELILAGNLSLGGNHTAVGQYDAKAQAFSVYPGASALAGPASAISAVLDGQFWVAGRASANGSAYVAKYANGAFTPAAGLGPGTDIRSVQVMSVTSAHAASALLPADEVLLLTGTINLPTYGNASAALFNGTAFTPYLLTSSGSGSGSGSGSSIAGIFVSNPAGFTTHATHHLALGLVVLIGLAIALALIFLLVLAGILLERRRRKNEGYVPMPAGGQAQRDPNLSRVPPSSLLARLGEKNAAPRI